MSYCRWSSDNFKCDVYVYADVSGGWTTHVKRDSSLDFNVETPGECAARLMSLRKQGYHVPQYAIDNLLTEQKEMDDNNGENT